ncbi:MAG: ATP-binding cassette domain-containing protein [Myxococcota bacterium]
MSLLRAQALSFSTGGHQLLAPLDLELSAGEVVAVVGPNGAGKSTLLRCLSREIRGGGQVFLGERRLRDLPGPERARRMAVLRQDTEVGFAFLVEHVVALGRLPFGDETGAAVGEALELFDIAHLAARTYPSLSGGEKRRVHLARVWAQVHGVPEPVLLLDEPLAALDLRHQERVIRAIRQRRDRGAGVVWVAHDLGAASLAADRVVVLDQGRVRALDVPSEALGVERVQSVFGVKARWVRGRLLVMPELPDSLDELG